jgi:branched-chain amino acid transport system substrate-binding protein
VVEADPYLPATPDLTPYLERMKRRGVQLVFVAGLEEDAARIIRDAGRVGLDARFLGGDGVEGLARMGPAYDGAMVGLLFHPDASPAARAFTERYRAAFHREPDSFAALGYDATRLLARAATEAGPRRAAIRDWLGRVGRDAEHPAFAGAPGAIRIDENGPPRVKGFAGGIGRGGEIVLSEEG